MDTAPGVIPGVVAGVVPGVIERVLRIEETTRGMRPRRRISAGSPSCVIGTSIRVDDPPSVSGYAGRVVAAACRNPESPSSLFRLVYYP